MSPFTIYLFNADVQIKLDNYFIANINGECCTTEYDFHTEVTNALNFPQYYGRNLDSLFDCLLDLEWIENNHIVIRMDNFEKIVSEESDKSYYKELLLLLINDLCQFKKTDPNNSEDIKNLYFLINHADSTQKILETSEIEYTQL
ncbi:MAG: barstar family protein [Saprospiraceae bacterium]|nr:barstar family protein [Saprospiraceae bacterium]